jgi:hypothetical protein
VVLVRSRDEDRARFVLATTSIEESWRRRARRRLVASLAGVLGALLALALVLPPTPAAGRDRCIAPAAQRVIGRGFVASCDPRAPSASER